jgi:hypothetical protein
MEKTQKVYIFKGRKVEIVKVENGQENFGFNIKAYVDGQDTNLRFTEKADVELYLKAVIE